MSVLHQALRERHGGEPRSFVRKDPIGTPVHSLAVVSWKKLSWHFPWSCLTRFEHDGSGKLEVLRLFFGAQEVVVEGKRLALLLPEISALRLQAIHEPPPDSETIAGTNEPVIQRVRVSVPLRQQANRSEVP